MKLIDIIFESVISLNEWAPSSQDEFIKKAKYKHGDKFSYENVDYKGDKNIINVTCHQKDENGNEHGSFPITPHNLLKANMGVGCDKCRKEKESERIRKGKENLINKGNQKHNDKFDYSQVDYKNNKTKVKIVCHKKDRNGVEHGAWEVRPNSHMAGNGCPICKQSKGEEKVRMYLDSQNIPFVQEMSYNDCISHNSKSGNSRYSCKKLEFDFYLKDQNTLIEYDGEFHFAKLRHIKDDKFMSQVMDDREKNRYTKVNDIKFIRIGYPDFDNIEEEISKGLNSNKQLYLSTNYPVDKGWRETKTPSVKKNKTYKEKMDLIKQIRSNDKL
jgi:hypothetical protein